MKISLITFEILLAIMERGGTDIQYINTDQGLR